MLHIWSQYDNAMISYYHNILITCTNLESFCTLGTPFDIVFNALFAYGCNLERSLEKYMFYKYAHISAPKGSPDTTLNAFDFKNHDLNKGIAPKASRPA